MIDIIITVYNTPIEDLKRCLNSIKNQSYKNWTAYIIDDGSKKEIADWLDSYGKTDKRFKIVHTENKGVSSARNTGLKLCTGDYITFCDSDDTLTEYCFEEGIKLIEKHNVDLVIGGFKLIYKSHSDLCTASQKKLYNEQNITELFEYMLTSKPKENDECLNKIMSTRAVAKIYKKDLLKNMIFSTDLKIHEDTLFSLEMIKKINSAFITNSIWYEYYQNDYSATHQGYNEVNLNQEIVFGEKVYKLKQFFKELNLYEAYKIRMFNIMTQYFKVLRKKNGNKQTEVNLILCNKAFSDVKNIDLSNYKYISIIDKYFKILLNIKSKKIKSFLLVITLNILNFINK